MKFEITYVKEQRAYFDIDASSQEEAENIAWKKIKDLDFESTDDEYDNPGMIFISLVSEED